MTSIAAESVSTILVSCKQTRFHIESPNYPLLRAIADKLIPGIPEQTRVSILQQTNISDVNTDDLPSGEVPGSRDGLTVLEDVVDKATAKSDLEQEINTLSAGVNDTDAYGALRSLRKLRHARMLKRLFVLDKDARLRSGARGMQARKALVEYEKAVAESAALNEQSTDDISPETLQVETQEAVDMLADLQLQVEPSLMADIESRAKKILTGLGFTDAYMAKKADSLSGGWRMRSALATALLQETDILILDEPTNFLDLLGIIWLQRFLQSLEDLPAPPTLILVSHDRDFTSSVCTDLLIVKDKDLTYFHGDLPTYEAARAEKKLYLTKMKEAQEKQKAHMQDDLRFPGTLVSLEKVSFRYALPKKGGGGGGGASTNPPATLQDATLTVSEGDRIGILGLNGAGKSTLIRLLVGANLAGAPPPGSSHTGTVTTHPRLKLSYYSQHAVEELQALGREEAGLTALALLTREVEGLLDEGQLRALLGSLGLQGRVASDVPLRKLSGGQLVRCELARLLWRGPGLLVLDEVTTHLDYETVAALREALRGWAGAVILVSHDR
ncbi:hypothetical protein CHGG_03898 [Chaetomium globosum CBS 148.51]|uniref:ABC transporter domain-containing protein n=1 Tax=Chaetomium globosum (strain ATCC 6205 / CBS 148.51 / DSM 1962 / NBRC 6347 / NRRL 1970) TaxID=306901 RepID=Q2H2U8_CHAGB|nr:uncharacterized protein CHGG_03898 [Chaetomium globosum CBS 148.51]EAQ87279.1 hypothetical protein CHGG_03898 [Chaetomium globosum CBS 148.51]